jgi:hypothetical protein
VDSGGCRRCPSRGWLPGLLWSLLREFAAADLGQFLQNSTQTSNQSILPRWQFSLILILLMLIEVFVMVSLLTNKSQLLENLHNAFGLPSTTSLPILMAENFSEKLRNGGRSPQSEANRNGAQLLRSHHRDKEQIHPGTTLSGDIGQCGKQQTSGKRSIDKVISRMAPKFECYYNLVNLTNFLNF